MREERVKRALARVLNKYASGETSGLQKKAIDPRLLTTPLGAAIGIAVAHKVMQKGKRKPLGYALGAGIGGAGGYVAGSYLRSGEKAKKLAEGKLSPAASLASLWQDFRNNPDMLSGDLRPTELEVVHNIGLDRPPVEISPEMQGLATVAKAWNNRLAYVNMELAKALQSKDPAAIKEWRGRKAQAQSSANSARSAVTGNFFTKPLKNISHPVKNPALYAWLSESFPEQLGRSEDVGQPSISEEGIGRLLWRILRAPYRRMGGRPF